MRKWMLILTVLLSLLCGCSGQEVSETTATPPETAAAAGVETEAISETTKAMAPEQAPAAEAVSSEEIIPEEWISDEETPETPTRPMEVVEEEFSQEQIVPEQSETLPEYEPEPNENETPLAIG